MLGAAAGFDATHRSIHSGFGLVLTGGVLNMFGNSAGIVTPIVIGYIVAATGSFDGALIEDNRGPAEQLEPSLL